MRTLLFALVALTLSGCGKGRSVSVGERGEKGIIRRDVDTAKDVSKAVSGQTKGEEDVYGS